MTWKLQGFVIGACMLIGLAACGQQAGSGSRAPESPPAAESTSTAQPAAATVLDPVPTPQGEPNTQPTMPVISSHGGAVKDHVSLVDNLRGTGLTVEIIGEVQQPFLRAKGTTLKISGGELKQPAEVQSYNYDDTDLGTDGLAAAQDDAEQIEPNGAPKTANILWRGVPHWFRTGRVIVLYVGNDPAVLDLLTALLGPQFAGQ
jgi:hypothetical protein